MERNYGGVVWTDHALQRLSTRGIAQGDAWATFRNPQKTYAGQRSGQFVYYRTYQDQKIEVVATKNEKGQWVILSVWSRPVWAKSNYGVKMGGLFDTLLERFLESILGWLKRRFSKET